MIKPQDYKQLDKLDSLGIIPTRTESAQQYFAKSRRLLNANVWYDASYMSLDVTSDIVRVKPSVLSELNRKYGADFHWVGLYPLKQSFWEVCFGESPAYCEIGCSKSDLIEYISVNINVEFFAQSWLRWFGYSAFYVLSHEMSHVGRIQLMDNDGSFDEIIASAGWHHIWHTYGVAGYDSSVGFFAWWGGVIWACLNMFMGFYWNGVCGLLLGAVIVLVLGWMEYSVWMQCKNSLAKYMKKDADVHHIMYRLYDDEIRSIAYNENNVLSLFTKNDWRLCFLKTKYTNL